jgi:outer membrane cobalamin receptor
MKSICTFVLAIFLSVPLVAAPLSGRVVDPDDRPVDGVRVFALGGGQILLSAVTNPRGEFMLQLPEGVRVEIRVAAAGFRAEPVALTTTAEAQDVGAIRLAVSAISESVLVSASQVEVPLSRASSSVTVITGAELDARQIHSVADALRAVPGMTVSAAGGPGAVTGAFPRGGESNFTLVFVDDVPVNAFGGEFDFAHLSTENVDRIEVVRGPQSAVFGSNAIGGVVRVITRRGGAPAGSASVERGGYVTWRAAAATSGSSGSFDWGASAERLRSDGYTGRTVRSGVTVRNDDYERTSGAVSAGWRVAGAAVRADVRYSTNERGNPGPFGSSPTGSITLLDDISRGANDNTLASISASLPVGRRVRAIFQGAYNRLDSDFVSPYDVSEASSRRWSWRAQLDSSLTPALGVSAGLELQRERAGSTYITGAQFQPIPIERTIGGYFGEARWNAGDRVFVTGGLRLERITRERIEAAPSAFPPRPELEQDTVTSLNPKAAAAWFVRPGASSYTKLRAAIGTGIRPPSGFDLAFTDNPGLKPERSFSAEAGVEQAMLGGGARFEATAFVNDYEDLIVAVGSFRESSRYTTDNISNARSRGIELGVTGRRRLGGSRTFDLYGRVSYTLLDTEILAVDGGGTAPPPFSVGDTLLRQPRHQFSLELTAAGGPLSAFVSGGGRTRFLDVEPVLGTFGGLFAAPGFSSWNAGAGWKIRRAGEIFGRLENLFDRHYEEALGFQALGRRATIGLRIAAGR